MRTHSRVTVASQKRKGRDDSGMGWSKLDKSAWEMKEEEVTLVLS